MAHLAGQSAYQRLVRRLNAFPQGAPDSELLRRILGLLLSEREAELVSRLPFRSFTVRDAARVWKLPDSETRAVLDALASRAVLLDSEVDGQTRWVLPPPMAGFFEFSMMRVRSDVDQKLLAELFYQYLNVEHEFVEALFGTGRTQLGRAFVHEPALPKVGLEVMDWERASETVRGARHMGVSMCYCRHKMHHVSRACGAPMEICMTFGNVAASLIRHGHARRVDAAEGLDLLARAWEAGLVQFGENVREDVGFICNCCGCCCEALIAARRVGHLHPVNTTAFLPVVDVGACNGCGKCVRSCPVEAMVLVSANDPHAPGRTVARLDHDACLGCGVCVRACPRGALRLERCGHRTLTPLDSVHRIVLMAIERGRLGHLLVDSHAVGWRAVAAVINAILRLPPLRQALATEQVRSRYLGALVARSRAR